MKILIVLHNNLFNRPRGGEKVAWEIIKYLRDFGYKCSVIMPDQEKEVSSEIREGIEFHYISIQNTGTYKKWFPVKEQIENKIRQINPDSVLVFSSPLVIINEICKKLQIPYVLRIGSHNYLSPETYPKNLMIERTPHDFYETFRKAFNEASSVIVNCKYGAKILKKVYGIDGKMVYNPVFPEKISETTGEYIIIPATEKISPNFLSLISEAMPNERFLTFTYKDSFEKNNVYYQGYTENMKQIWEKANLFLFPCNFDLIGTSSQVIEAMINGIPTITIEKSGFSELNFLTVSEKSTLKDWITKINQIEKRWKYYSRVTQRYIFEHYDARRELEKVRQAIEDSIPAKGRVLYYLKEGIGNLIQEIPSIKAIKSLGYKVDGLIDSTSSAGEELMMNLPYLDEKFKSLPNDVSQYDHLASTFPIAPFGGKIVTRKSNHDLPEREWYMAVPKTLGYEGITPTTEIFYKKTFLKTYANSVVFAPGIVSKSWDLKRWDHFDQLANYFHHVFLIGAETDLLPDYKWPKHTTNLIGKLSFQETISLIEQCTLFVGNDGGLAHVATVLGIPTFVIFGPTSIVKNAERGAIPITKQPPESCQPCQFTPNFLNCEDRKCMNNLTPEMVMNTIKENYKSDLIYYETV